MMLSVTLLILFVSAGCGSLFYGEEEDVYWEDEPQPAVSTKEIEEVKQKIDELSRKFDGTETKITVLEDDVDDINSRLQREEESLNELNRTLGQIKSGEKSSSPEEINELERDIRIMENDIKWLKTIQGQSLP